MQKIKKYTTKQTEKEIVNAILEFLLWKKLFVWRNQSIGLYDVKQQTFRSLPRYAINGVCDILGILPDGRFLGIEVKTSTGKPSDNQMEFIKKIIANNGVAFIARSIDEVQEILRKYKVMV